MFWQNTSCSKSTYYVLGSSSTYSKDLSIMIENDKPVFSLGTLNMCNTNLQA